MIRENQKGFSLIELMVVVSVIGVLAGIAIPQYKNFRTKAYETEAKAQLASIYTSETSFRTEYDGYHTSLKVLGSGAAGKARFNVGFGSIGIIPPEAPLEVVFLSTKMMCSGIFGFGTDPNCNMVIDTPILPLTSTTTANNFVASAVAFEDLLLASTQRTQSTPLLVLATSFLGINEAWAGLPPMPPDPVEISLFSTKLITVWQINHEKKLTTLQVMYSCFGAVPCPGLVIPD